MSNSTNSKHISHNKELPKKHTIIMLICCLAPLLLIVALSSLGIIGGWGFLALILLCPMLHLFMMKVMYREKEDHESLWNIPRIGEERSADYYESKTD
jgi:amino acid permease